MPLSLELSRRDVIVGLGKMAGAAVAASHLPTPNISTALPGVQNERGSVSTSEIRPKKQALSSREIRWRRHDPFLIGNEDEIYTFRTYSLEENTYLDGDLRLDFDTEAYLNLLTNAAKLTHKTADLNYYLSHHRLRIWLNAPPLGDGSAYYLAVGRWLADPVVAYSLDEFGYILDSVKAKIPNLRSLVGPEILEGFPFLPGHVSETDVHEAWHLLEDATLVHKLPRSTHKPLGAVTLALSAERFANGVIDPRYDRGSGPSRRSFIRSAIVGGAAYVGATLGANLSTPLRLIDHIYADNIVDGLANHPDIRDLPSPFRPVVLKVS